MPPPKRSTRSTADPVLLSLPNRPRRTQDESTTVTIHPSGPTRAPAGSNEEEAYQSTEEGPSIRHRSLSQEIGVQGSPPIRKKHAPLPKSGYNVSPAVSAREKEKLRRLSADKSVLGASMSEEATPKLPRRRSSMPKGATTRTKKKSKGQGHNAAAETQDFIVVADPSNYKRLRVGSVGHADPDPSDARSTPLVKYKAPSTKRTRRSSLERALSMDRLLSAVVKTSTQVEETMSDDNTMDAQVDRLELSMEEKQLQEEELQRITKEEECHAREDHEMTDGASARQKVGSVKVNGSRKVAGKTTNGDLVVQEIPGESGLFGGGSEASYAESPPRNYEENMNDLSPRSAVAIHNGSPSASNKLRASNPGSEGEGDEVLILCLDRIQESVNQFNSTSDHLHELSNAFRTLKTLQKPVRNDEVGYYRLIQDVLEPIVANSDAPISAEEQAVLDHLIDVRDSLAGFHTKAKYFENTLRQLLRMNLTQLSNIEKSQRAIKCGFQARGFSVEGEEWRVGRGTGVAQRIEAERAANLEAMKKKNEEIERVLSQRERIMIGYQTESVRERRRLKNKEVNLSRQNRIHADEADEGEEVDEHSQDMISADEEIGGEIEQELEEVGEEEEGEVEDEEGYSHDPIHMNEEPVYREEHSEYGSSDQQGSEFSEEQEVGSPIVIGEDEVEVVQVEGFGERAAKERVRVEREARRGDRGSDEEMEVLEDREWAEEELDALFEGMDLFQGKYLFEQIQNEYGHGQSAPLRHRGVDDMKRKAREIKREIVESGGADFLSHSWKAV